MASTKCIISCFYIDSAGAISLASTSTDSTDLCLATAAVGEYRQISGTWSRSRTRTTIKDKSGLGSELKVEITTRTRATKDLFLVRTAGALQRHCEGGESSP